MAPFSTRRKGNDDDETAFDLKQGMKQSSTMLQLHVYSRQNIC